MTLKRAFQYLYAILGGAILGVGLSATADCIYARYKGDSADPRCVYGWKGYVIEKTFDDDGEHIHVSCQYRPDITERKIP